MSGKTKLQMRVDLRTDLKDSGALWSNAELDRCIERAFADLSRFLPREKVYEESLQFTITDEAYTSPATTSLTAIVNAQAINVAAGSYLTIAGQPDVARKVRLTITDADSSTTGATFIVEGEDKDGKSMSEIFHYSRGYSKTINGIKEFKYVYTVELDQVAGSAAGDTLSVGYGLYSDPWIYLAYKPIKEFSEVVTTSPAGTTYTRDTDYEIDYHNGRIRAKAGKMAAATAYLIDYTKSGLAIDISSLPDFIRVDRCFYPSDAIPQQEISPEVWANMLWVLGDHLSQGSLQEDKHIAVRYLAEHQPPTDYSPGSEPEFLSNTLLLLASAYAIDIYSIKHELQAETDLASARTSLASATSAQTAVSTALTNIKKYLDNNSSADAAGLLAQITTDIANLRTAIATALDAANAHFDGVAANLTSANSTTNTNNIGGESTEVPLAYIRQAEARAQTGLGYCQEASQRLNNLATYIEQAAGYTNIANGFVSEAQGRLSQLGDYIQTATGYMTAAVQALNLADRLREESSKRKLEVQSIWRDRKEYVGSDTYSVARLQIPY